MTADRHLFPFHTHSAMGCSTPPTYRRTVLLESDPSLSLFPSLYARQMPWQPPEHTTDQCATQRNDKPTTPLCPDRPTNPAVLSPMHLYIIQYPPPAHQRRHPDRFCSRIQPRPCWPAGRAGPPTGTSRACRCPTPRRGRMPPLRRHFRGVRSGPCTASRDRRTVSWTCAGSIPKSCQVPADKFAAVPAPPGV